MSGPKVVRIVTREEILEICQGMLARVDSALEQWIRIGQRNDCIDEGAIAEAQARRAKLSAMLARDQFMELQKQAPLEEQFLRDDLQHRLVAAAAAQASQRARDRRKSENSAAVLAALRRAGTPLASDLEEAIGRGDGSAIARAMDLLASSNEPDVDRELASALKDEAASSKGGLWISGAAQSDPAIESILNRIAQIQQLDPAVADSIWDERLEAIEKSSAEQRGLLLDVLEVETGRRLDEVKQRAGLVDDLLAIIAEAHATGLEVAIDEDRVPALRMQQLEQQIAEIREMVANRRKERAAAESRAVLLKALGDLGYEVTEGMQTATPVEGKLVLKSASRPDYGVEITGAERLQLRPVAFTRGGAGPDVSRDRDAETIWCGDVSVLEAALEGAGAELKIEKSTPVGAVALKRIAVASIASVERREAPEPKQRSVPS